MDFNFSIVFNDYLRDLIPLKIQLDNLKLIKDLILRLFLKNQIKLMQLHAI